MSASNEKDAQRSDPFAQMRAAQERVTDLREQAQRWIESPPEKPGALFVAIPASPDDVFWLCDRLDRVLATMQDATVTYGIINGGGESVTPMMVERDALAEALDGR